MPRRVTRIFHNVTDTWIILSNGLTVTPGHHFLDAFGNFRTIADILKTDGQVVLADGTIAKVTGEYIHYSEATADRFEQAEGYFAATVGGLALQPVYKKGWKTYNFEIEDLHTYVAGGVRVHNASVVTASGLHTYPGTVYQTGSGPVIVNQNGSYTHADGRVSGVGTRQYNADTNSWETVQPGPGPRYQITGTGPIVTLASGTRIEAGTRFETGNGVSFVNIDGSVTSITPNDVVNTHGVGTRRYDADTNSWVTVQVPITPSPTREPSNPSRPPVGTVLGVAANGGIVVQGHSGPMNSITQNSEAWRKATGQSGPGSWNNGVYTSPSGGYYYARHIHGAPTSGSSSGSSSRGGSSFGDSIFSPVLLDLDGGGLTIDPLSASSQFVDLAGDGFVQRTAWAGAGTGVLVIDTDGDGKISRANEFVFTEWDSSATGDLEAIRNVFDTNHNGLLDAGDARWGEFRVMVDGVLQTLDSLGIASIDLRPKGSAQQFADGSSIGGTTIFTRTDGTTGLVGDAALASDSKSYRVERSSATGSDGAVTETLLGYNRDGSLAFRNVITTSAGGASRLTQFDDDGNDTFDRSQSDGLVIAADGTRTRTISNFAADGALVDRTMTQASADGLSVTTTIDQNGDGLADQSTTLTTGADGSSTSLTKAFGRDGTLSKQVQVSVSADGLSKTTSTDANGDGVFEIIDQETTTVHADGSRTKLESRRAANGALLTQIESVTSADNRSKTVKYDRSGTGVFDETAITTIAIDSTGKVSTTVSRPNTGGGSRSQTVTTVSTDGLVQQKAQDLTGDGVADRITAQETTINADGSQVQTTTLKSANGALLSKTNTTTSSDRKSITTTEDSNGDGAVDGTTSIVMGADGVITKTTSQSAPNGGLIGRSVSQTSADGLTTTSQLDVSGDGAIDSTELAVTVANADGSQTRTVTTKAGNGAMVGSTSTQTSADSRNQTISIDVSGDGVADQIENRTLLLNADGSRTETLESKAGNGAVLNRAVTTTSADRQTVTRTVDDNGDGKVDLTEIQTRHANGSQGLTVTRTNSAGTVLSKTTTTISSDGFTRTVEQDVDGAGLIDSKSVSTTTLNADGSRTVTTTNSRGGTVTGTTITKASANGLIKSEATDVDGNGTTDTVVNETIVLDTYGNRTTTVLRTNGSKRVGQTATTVNATGLSTSTRFDSDGNSSTDRIETITRQLKADGSTLDTAVTRSVTGTLLARVVTETDGDGKTITTTEDSNGDGVVDVRVEASVAADGTHTVSRRQLGAAGVLLSQSTTQTSADGLVQTIKRDGEGNGTFETVIADITTINADGSRTRTVSQTKADGTLVSREAVTTSANGLNRTISWAGAAGMALGSETVAKVLNADGSTRETVSRFKPDGTTLERKVTTLTSGDGRSVITQVDLNGDGKVDQQTEIARQADGQLVETRTDYASDDVTARAKTTITTSANGLIKTTRYDDNADGVVERQTVQTIVLNANGSKTETTENFGPGAALLNRVVIEASANGLVENWRASGAASSVDTRRDVTVLNADGSTTQTVTIGNESGSEISSQDISTRTVSANGLSVTTRWAAIGQEQTDVTILNNNGSKTRTITSSAIGGAQISRTTTTTSANGLTATTLEERTGELNRTLTSTRVDRADGFVVETLTTHNAAGVLLDKTVISTSPDQRLVTITRDADGDGQMDQHERRTIAVDGSTLVVITGYRANLRVDNVTTARTSADGLTTTTDRDGNADGILEHKRVSVTTQNASGERVTVTTDRDETGKLIGKITVTVSADGQTKTSVEDVNGEGNALDQTETVKADGGRYITTVLENNAEAQDIANLAAGVVYWKKAIARKVVTSTAIDGMETVISSDYAGDSGLEHVVRAVTQIDGSIVSTMTEKNAAGAIIAKGTMTQSADGRVITLELDSDNNGTIDRSETAVTRIDGSVLLTAIDRNPDGSLKQTVTETISASGRLRSSLTSDGLGRKTAETVTTYATSTTTTYDAAGGQPLSVVLANSKGVVTGITLYDPLNANAWSRVVQSFNAAGKKTSEIQYLDDGTRVEIRFDAASGKESWLDFYNASGVLTGDTQYDLVNGNYWSRIDRSYDAAGNITIYDALSDNGTRSRTLHDRDNTHPWTSIAQTFNAQGQQTVEMQNMDDGTKAVVIFDVASGKIDQVNYLNTAGVLTSTTQHDFANANAWLSIERSYDSTGRLTAFDQLNDNGTRDRTLYDPANANGWATIVQAFNSAGKQTTETQNMDNGSRNVVTFDVASGKVAQVNYHNASGVLTNTVQHDFANANAWLRIEQSFDTAGRVTVYDQVNDNGTRDTTLYDPANANPWTTVVQSFNAAGQKLTETQNMDGGNKTGMTFDAASGKTSWVRSYNTSGVLIGATQYDFGNATSWSSIYWTYDSAGRVTSKYLTYDDGIRVAVSIDAATGARTSQTDYNASGQKIGEAWFRTNGEVYQANVYDPANTNSWSSISWTEKSNLRGIYFQAAVTMDAGAGGGMNPPNYNVSRAGLDSYFPYWSRAQSPVLLDLNGDGQIDLRPLDEDTVFPEVFFDWDGDGGRNGSAWVGPDDGFLTIDLAADGGAGGDGLIDQTRELAFSTWVDSTPETDDPITDLEGLRLVFDTNHDGIFDSTDARWDEFRVWRDVNQNGIAEDGELRTLSEAGIKLINLMPSSSDAQLFADGSAITGTSTYQKTDGTSLLVADASLAYRSQNVGI